MNIGPLYPALTAPAQIMAENSEGRWFVYPISERAISNMNDPTFSFMAALKTISAKMYVIPLTFIAGTVNPFASPLPIAS